MEGLTNLSITRLEGLTRDLTNPLFETNPIEAQHVIEVYRPKA